MLVKVQEVEGDGLVGLLGKNVLLFCMNYNYTGKLVGVNDTFVKLEDPKIVFETGDFKSKAWKDVQPMPSQFAYVNTRSIESFCESVK